MLQSDIGDKGPNPFHVVESGVPLRETRVEQVERNLPALVDAKNVSAFEIEKVINDPVFGLINKMKIQNADRRLKEKHYRETSGYKKS